MSLFAKVRRQKLLSFTLVLFSLSIGVLIGTLISTGVKAAKDTTTVAPGATPLSIPRPEQLSTAFSQIAKQVEPSVVNISTTYLPKEPVQSRNRRRATPDRGDDMEDFFYRFFGNPFEESPDTPRRRGTALGSGVVIDKSGYILTNNHVVDKADRIQVKFTEDSTQYDAKVIGVDKETDLAVIRVENRPNLVPAHVGNSDSVQVGDWAVAIGSPFGFQATVTAGIISAKERTVGEVGTQFQHFLQTDAAINPGNSGGPLLNIKGEVIGINTAIASRSGGFQGIGFALPINTAAKVYNQIIKTGRVTRGSIGIRFQASDAPGTRELLKAYGATEGVFVQTVAPDGPAAKAGIKAGDVIVAFNGQPIRSGDELVEHVTGTPVGEPAKITILREGKRQDVNVTVADLTKVFPDQFGAGPSEEPERAEGTEAKFGITIENLNDARRSSMGIEQKGGVLISHVEPGSFSEDIGMQPNDVLLEINRQAVSTVDDVKRIQNTLKPGQAVAFRVLRKLDRTWNAIFLAGTMPSH
jgi:serine protease Do